MGVALKLGFGVAFHLAVYAESPALAWVGLIVLGVFALTDIVEHVHQKRQYRLFGGLPLRLTTETPRLGAELAGAFIITLTPQEVDSAWVSLSCLRVQPATGDFERTQKELWTRRVPATIVASGSGCQATFVVTIAATQPRSTYTKGMKIRDVSVEFDEWQVSLEVRTKHGRVAVQSTCVTVYAGL